MGVRLRIRSASSIAAVIAVLAGCGGGGGGGTTSAGPSLPIAAQFGVTVLNSVLYGSTPSSISFSVADATRSCIAFPEPFSDDHLAYDASVVRGVQLLDCGTDGWFTVTFHALDVPLADTTVKWTVSESGLSKSIVKQGGLCVQAAGGSDLKERVTEKHASGCPR